MKLNKLNRAALLSAAVLLGISSAQAAPLVDLTLEGSLTDNGTDWSTSTAPVAGQPYYFELTAVIAGPGTTNSNVILSSTKTYTTNSNGQLSDDGISNLTNVTLTDADSQTLSLTVDTPWTKGTGATAATVTGSSVEFSALLATGSPNQGGTTPVQIATGSLTADASSDSLAISFTPQASSNDSVFTGKIDTTSSDTVFSGKAVVPTVSSGTVDPYVNSASLSLTPASSNPSIPISVGTTTPGYGVVNPSTITVTGSHAGGYTPATVHLQTPAATGYIQEAGIAANDPEFFALKLSGVTANGYTDSGIVTDINGTAANTGVTASLVSTSVFASTFSGFDILLTVNSADDENSQFLGFDFSQLTGVDVTDIGAVPEPASLGILALGGIALMRRRRTSRTPMAN